ncbi:zinc finger CCCH domain-containing protein 32-like isoform X2 [Nymphaea colorata]|uniref:zinc finger CCCH domain-containing protein 32-like isoform X2 n=1 Tax=Nymphaea colorata TaxID=210225 RepID=UPI00129D5A2A|nr:zinc finger CCCH domain-containing protein 32-like isoform X2 [Nymphaea colorata]
MPKGADCEFRHSEVARVNPRDCWFWRNGNCLNPKCAFRHPPLDGFRGNSAAPSSSVSRPALPPAAPLAHFPSYMPGPYQSPAYSSNRQKIPCYYFQKGTCLKGDKCPFMHGSQPAGDSTSSQVAETVPASDSHSIKKTMKGTGDSILQQENPSGDTIQRVEIPAIVKANAEAGHASTSPPEKNLLINGGDKSRMCIQSSMLVCGGNTLSTHHTHQSQVNDAQAENGKDVDECLGESSPGFDVLVDDDVEEAEYFDTDIEGALSHSRRHLKSMREFDYTASCMDPLGEFEESEVDPPDAYRRNQDLHGREQSHACMDWGLERPSSEERILRFGEESHDVTNGQDLRYHLSKQRRANGSAIGAGSDRHGDLWRRDDKLERYHRHSYEELAQYSNVESSISSRLKGRIKFPGNHSQDPSSERYLDMETKRRQMRIRSSPSRSMVHRETHNNKARGRPNAALRTGEISDYPQHSSASSNRQILKSQVVHEGDEQNVRPRKFSSQDSSAQLSFEGPKPLSVILKRKRAMVSVDSSGSRNADEKSQIESPDEASEPMNMVQPSEILKESCCDVHGPNNVQNSKGKLDSRDEVYSVQNDGLPLQMDCNAPVEDGSVLEIQDQHAENLDVNGEFDDAGSEGRNWKEENPDGEDEYLEDEDGDDFARKLGVMFS